MRFIELIYVWEYGLAHMSLSGKSLPKKKEEEKIKTLIKRKNPSQVVQPSFFFKYLSNYLQSLRLEPDFDSVQSQSRRQQLRARLKKTHQNEINGAITFLYVVERIQDFITLDFGSLSRINSGEDICTGENGIRYNIYIKCITRRRNRTKTNKQKNERMICIQHFQSENDSE